MCSLKNCVENPLECSVSLIYCPEDKPLTCSNGNCVSKYIECIGDLSDSRILEEVGGD